MVGCGEIKKLSLDETNSTQAEYNFWLYKKTSDDRVYKPIKEWVAPEFVGTGKLVCSWKQPKQSHPVIAGIKTVGVYPESWGVMDPGTGRMIDKYSDEYHAQMVNMFMHQELVIQVGYIMMFGSLPVESLLKIGVQKIYP